MSKFQATPQPKSRASLLALTTATLALTAAMTFTAPAAYAAECQQTGATSTGTGQAPTDGGDLESNRSARQYTYAYCV